MDYASLIEDFKNGTLNPKHVTLVMDNDGGYLNYYDEDQDDDFNEAEGDKLRKKYGSPDGYNDIVAVLKASGVNAEWC